MYVRINGSYNLNYWERYMVYLVSTLIERSLYLSQILARDLQTVTGSMQEDGLFLLNELLDEKASDLTLIPYYKEFDVDTVQGQEMYFIPNLTEADSVTFNIGDVRFSMNELTRKEYFSTPRVDNLQALPFSYRIERCLGGSNLYLYFVPNQDYLVKIWGKFGLSEVTLNQDLSLTYDGFYISYLRHHLASKFCSEYGQTFPDGAQKEFMRIEKKLKSISPTDLSISKRSFFTTNSTFDWQFVNLSQGYWPF
jgi:hypothetical protein